MTKVNVKLLRGTLQYIKDHPDEWRQDKWHCGSAGCFAWRAGSLAKATPLVEGDLIPQWASSGFTDLQRYVETYSWLTNAERTGQQLVENEISAVIPPGLTAEEKVEIFDFAREELGLSKEDSDILFAGGNTLEDLEEMVEILCAEGTLAGSRFGSECDYCCGWHNSEDCPEHEEPEEEDFWCRECEIDCSCCCSCE